MNVLILLLLVVNAVGIAFLLLRSGTQKGGDDGRLERVFKEEMQLNRRELAVNVKDSSDSMDKRLAGIAAHQAQAIAKLVETVEKKLQLMQHDNAQQLEKMRVTVDEKLQSTLEKRLGESFKQVGDRLEQVHKGLGEMQQLANGVGDLKRVLTNVKTRGTWGEIQLESLLEQILVREQYDKNVEVVKGSGARVEFAIKIPAKDEKNSIVWLPIDAKFPMEDYQRLIAAQDAANPIEVAVHLKALENRIKLEAKKIHEKYIHPPESTDFALLYLPTEGLYAEVIQHPDLAQSIQQTHRVIVAGPHTIAALLNSLQMGFRTLAIEKRTSEVWEALASVRTEFGKFGDILEKTKQKLEQATSTIDSAASKSRTIERKLQKVQTLEPKSEDPKLLEI
ncbi:MAG TPA: DNA recombination protein RmuC [Candidatus Saccharimonadales bacterium]|nr:DNA recombination protein RmuC [Candidatus Saccharimonadales bacterium]